MNKVILLSSLIVVLSACGQGPRGEKGDTSLAVSPVPSEQMEIDTIVLDENAYRLGLGQTALTSGLSCSLSTFTSGDRIQSSISGHNTLSPLSQVATFLLKKEINQPEGPITDRMNILPSVLQPIYQNLYLIRCQGQLVVKETGYHGFELTSDDASLLYVDGAKIIDGDNSHGPIVFSTMKYLRKGVHTIRVDYAQSGGGLQVFILKQNNEVLKPAYFFH